MKVQGYEFSSDFKSMSEEDFLKEMKSRFKTKVKDARTIYNELHGNGATVTAKDSSIGEKGESGEPGLSGTEETEKGAGKDTEGEA